ncbi:WecB/TagA/CpsF family glycosyltransferase [Rhizobiaceae bacterium BDR2-2]|uniref:WecB/TagA/CpsF family glycosyltransferase n=1 Tax=Ectorhizobium quercum TaxID=2965071 RepID=A0AAE3MVC6_9HYPH|nr:WecB/TagA/CpsF family glycosyltransferase [Ectorhizobium quercum]MCX8995868.1 WecB/TagA/CpsF family glycosyltransferase [Ectorhizobium quercum]
MANILIDTDIFERKEYFLNVPYTNIEFENVVELIDSVHGYEKFFYIVTPNVDHAVRLRDNEALRDVYRGAWLSLCDSKPISWMARALFLRLYLVTGSDLTSRLFHETIREGDHVVLIAPYEEVGLKMAKRFPHIEFRCHVPPPDVINNPDAMAECVDFAATGRPDFVFIAIGSPQSELIAHQLSKEPGANGVCICCGASLEFITDLKKRAPVGMQRFGFEWLYRLMSDPRRLWRRYVFAVPPLISMFAAEALRRAKMASSPVGIKSAFSRRLKKI